MTSYCVKCSTKTADVDGETTAKNGRQGMRSKCDECGGRGSLMFAAKGRSRRTLCCLMMLCWRRTRATASNKSMADLRSTNRTKNIYGDAKKNRVRCKNAGLHHTVTINPFLRSKRKMAPQAKQYSHFAGIDEKYEVSFKGN